MTMPRLRPGDRQRVVLGALAGREKPGGCTHIEPVSPIRGNACKSHHSVTSLPCIVAARAHARAGRARSGREPTRGGCTRDCGNRSKPWRPEEICEARRGWAGPRSCATALLARRRDCGLNAVKQAFEHAVVKRLDLLAPKRLIVPERVTLQDVAQQCPAVYRLELEPVLDL